ncbi:unnamed protein product, partial [Iphiclides podalirius]
MRIATRPLATVRHSPPPLISTRPTDQQGTTAQRVFSQNTGHATTGCTHDGNNRATFAERSGRVVGRGARDITLSTVAGTLRARAPGAPRRRRVAPASRGRGRPARRGEPGSLITRGRSGTAIESGRELLARREGRRSP